MAPQFITGGLIIGTILNLDIIGAVAPWVVVRIGVDGLPAAALLFATLLVNSKEGAVHLVLV